MCREKPRWKCANCSAAAGAVAQICGFRPTGFVADPIWYLGQLFPFLNWFLFVFEMDVLATLPCTRGSVDWYWISNPPSTHVTHWHLNQWKESIPFYARNSTKDFRSRFASFFLFSSSVFPLVAVYGRIGWEQFQQQIHFIVHQLWCGSHGGARVVP